DGNIIFSRAYGLASLEYLVPNTPGTIFNTGSVSKQFTAMGIVRLEEQGSLSFDDEIHKFLPELPDFGVPITIRHLLHHTSGLRSLHALFALAGWRDDDSRSNEDLNRIILNQKDLNFTPGSEYLYCNTGYMLMVNIIEGITGENFKDWMKKQIFDPLGMKQTYVEDQYSRVVANNATSYYRRGDFERAVEYWGYIGSGNMHSTTGDLLKWLSNFETPLKGWESSFKKMQTLDPFNNGTPNNYAFGVVVDKHLGERRIQHGGAIGGFRAFVAAYPDKKLNIAILTNFSTGNPGGNADEIAAIILGDPHTDTDQSGAIASVPLSKAALSRFEGKYWDKDGKLVRQIYLKQDTLRYSRSERNESPLIPVGNTVFKMAGAGDGVTVKFETSDEGQQMEFSENGIPSSVFDLVEMTDNGEEVLPDYLGEYYSSEVQTSYSITMEADHIKMYHPRHGVIPLKIEFKDVFSGEWPIGTVEVKRNTEGQVEGIFISNGRVRNAWFEKE
ncbi:serine hydrolase domain-containing protein, partial [Robiginitalea sp.]|uniref:serine hydrolase domain-containing protein n=1 Tax=Robiginitalea sp. TaxID=1902411 RepID=UPI003C71E613